MEEMISALRARKAYDFTRPDDRSADVFVHHTSIAGGGFASLDEGEKVTYEAVRGRRGMQAENVSKATGGRSFERKTLWRCLSASKRQLLVGMGWV
jgi:CspA family cold shock protein